MTEDEIVKDMGNRIRYRLEDVVKRGLVSNTQASREQVQDIVREEFDRANQRVEKLYTK